MFEDFRLRVFLTVAQCGSFTQAAHELGISQPAVSQHIAEIEKFVRVKLFERSRSKVVLTEEGKLFLKHAQNILDGYKKAENTFIAPKSILIRNVLFEGSLRNILIEHQRFADLDAPSDVEVDKVIDGVGQAIIPSFFNTHTHAAMNILRGYADDIPLQQWLEDYIWPTEDKFTPEDIRKGSLLAAKEMIATGTTFFSDMYFDIEETIATVEQSGLRAAIGITVMENHTKAVEEAKLSFIKNWSDPTDGRIQLVVAPHSVYTVGPEKLKKAAALARKYGLRLHIHLSETEKEVSDCVREHGMTPVRYLDSLGFLGPDVIAAHCVHVDREEWRLLSRRGVTVSHCPCSNMKLGSGRFPYELALESGVRITLGTDGASSNNNLSMMEEMKFAALLAKLTGNASLASAEQVFTWATKNGAQAFGIDAGEIAKGKRADALLVDLGNYSLMPCHNLISNLVYSANPSCVTSVLCDGKVLIPRSI